MEKQFKLDPLEIEILHHALVAIKDSYMVNQHASYKRRYENLVAIFNI